MKSQRVEALEIIEEDLKAAKSFYDSWRVNGSAYFKAQFDEAVAWIEWNPEMFPKKYRHYRRAIIRNTYFAIFYVIEPGATAAIYFEELGKSTSLKN